MVGAVRVLAARLSLARMKKIFSAPADLEMKPSERTAAVTQSKMARPKQTTTNIAAVCREFGAPTGSISMRVRFGRSIVEAWVFTTQRSAPSSATDTQPTVRGPSCMWRCGAARPGIRVSGFICRAWRAVHGGSNVNENLSSNSFCPWFLTHRCGPPLSTRQPSDQPESVFLLPPSATHRLHLRGPSAPDPINRAPAPQSHALLP